MPDNSKLTNIVAIVTLAQNLTPLAMSMIAQFANRLKDKTDDEILAQSDEIFDRVIQRAKDEQADAQPPGSEP